METLLSEGGRFLETLANSTSAADTLALASGCTYTMTSTHDGLLGASALPLITTPIEMIGPATITRSSLLAFRIAEVSKTGALTLTTGVVLTNGSAHGDGGAILNHGAVALTGSSLSGNTAALNGGGIATVDSTAQPSPPAPANHNEHCAGPTAGPARPSSSRPGRIAWLTQRQGPEAHRRMLDKAAEILRTRQNPDAVPIEDVRASINQRLGR